MTEFVALLTKTQWFSLGSACMSIGVFLFIFLLLRKPPTMPKPIPVSVHRESKPEPHDIHVKAYGASGIGSRSTQQDCFFLPELSVSENIVEQRGLLAVVCDGMGGLDGGELASAICTQMMQKAYYYDAAGELDAESFFKRIIPLADAEVESLTDENGDALHAGTTLVSAIVRGNTFYWASVGDSRIYLCHGGMLEQLTRDHNYLLHLMDQVNAGLLTEEDARLHPKREALISYIGLGSVSLVDIEATGIILQEGDIVLLCSDGLYKALSDGEILSVLQKYRTEASGLPDKLLQAAMEKHWMKHDNITVVVLHAQLHEAGEKPT